MNGQTTKVVKPETGRRRAPKLAASTRGAAGKHAAAAKVGS